MSEIVLVVAIADNGVIGNNGAIPWHISDDLKRFKALTLGHAVVMGRKTWDSLPRKPLPGRRNIVCTRDPGWKAQVPDVLAITSPDIDLSFLAPDEKIMVIGGAEIYRYFLSRADRIELTEVHKDFEGDARFVLDRTGWHETLREEHVTPDGLRYSYVTLTR